MGIFDTIKKNFNRGGVKIAVLAPPTAARQNATIPVTVTIVATEPQIVNMVNVKLERTLHYDEKTGIAINNGNMADDKLTFAEVTLNGPLQLEAGGTKTIETQLELKIYIAEPSYISKTPLEQAPNEGLIGTIKGLTDSRAQPQRYDYYIVATADIEGIMLDPSAKVRIELL